MKKAFCILSLFLFAALSAYSHNVFDVEWCRNNGGTIEFDANYNIDFNCTTFSVFSTSYIEKIYNIVCIPCYSSVLKNKEPLFLKLVGEGESNTSNMFDEYNFKMTESDLVRYI